MHENNTQKAQEKINYILNMESLSKSKEITIIIKPVSHSCNIECTYCFYNERQKDITINTFMSNEILEKILYSINSIPNDTRCKIIFHGGEPLLIGLKFYQNFIAIKNKILIKKNVIVKMQTNALLLNSHWCNFFEINNINIGTSLDGTQEIHDFYRLDKNHDGTYKKTLEKIKLISQYNISLLVLSTIVKKSLGNEKKIFKNFVDNNINKFELNPCFDSNDGSNITPYEWVKFMIKIFDIWLFESKMKVDIIFFKEIIRNILGEKSISCEMSKGCSNKFTTNAEGNFFHCDDIAIKNSHQGSLIDNNLSELLNKENIFDSKRIEFEKTVGCATCEFHYVCQGYCPRYYHLGQDLCDSLKFLYLHIHKRLIEIKLLKPSV